MLACPGDPRLRSVLVGVAYLAERYYRSAALGAACVPLRYRHGVLLLGRAYAALGWRAARGQSTAATPGRLSMTFRAKHLATLVVTALHPRTLGLVASPPHDASLHHAVAGWPGTHDGAPAARVR